jgi:hypothetical protein
LPATDLEAIHPALGGISLALSLVDPQRRINAAVRADYKSIREGLAGQWLCQAALVVLEKAAEIFVAHERGKIPLFRGD